MKRLKAFILGSIFAALGVLQAVFAVLKLFDVIDWKWGIVMTPGFVIILIFDTILIYAALSAAKEGENEN